MSATSIPDVPPGLSDYFTRFLRALKRAVENGGAVGATGPTGPRGPSSYLREATWDNGSSALVAANAKPVFVKCPIAGMIIGWEIHTQGGSGSCVVDVWKAQFAAASNPAVGNTITAAAKPAVSAGVNAQAGTLPGWTTVVNAGDVIGFHLDSVSTFTNVSISLTIQA
jgi:hypothetical protein